LYIPFIHLPAKSILNLYVTLMSIRIIYKFKNCNNNKRSITSDVLEKLSELFGVLADSLYGE